MRIMTTSNGPPMLLRKGTPASYSAHIAARAERHTHHCAPARSSPSRAKRCARLHLPCRDFSSMVIDYPSYQTTMSGTPGLTPRALRQWNAPLSVAMAAAPSSSAIGTSRPSGNLLRRSRVYRGFPLISCAPCPTGLPLLLVGVRHRLSRHAERRRSTDLALDDAHDRARVQR
jgi:hypothetical protein